MAAKTRLGEGGYGVRRYMVGAFANKQQSVSSKIVAAPVLSAKKQNPSLQGKVDR